MEKFKLYQNRLREMLAKYSRKQLITGAAIGAAVIVLAITIAVILNRQNYVVMYSDIPQDEANQIIGRLQEAGVDYRYDAAGDILVPADKVDQTRADLANEGYPKSGFTYDVFTDNAGGMTTDSEKQIYKIYELQNRIGATIRLFDGVRDAKVTIAASEDEAYVLSSEDEENAAASASVVVTMKDGGAPTAKQASAMRRLVAGSVPKMKMENVTVIDGNGIEVSASGGESGGSTGEEIAQLIETQISKKVLNVLGPFYGAENIRVSARGKVDMEKVIRESTTYETPEKIDEEDKTGIISSEATAKDTSGSGGGAGGVAGTEANADETEYNSGDDGSGGSSAQSETATRDYLVNQIREQGEIDPGVLKDLTVSVAINSETLKTLNLNQLRDLVGNATGIIGEDRENKITIVNAPFHEAAADDADSHPAADMIMTRLNKYKWLIAAVVGVLVLASAVFIILRKRRRKREDQTELEEIREFSAEEEAEVQIRPERINAKNGKEQALRENVREFAQGNPEISAQMIKEWLNGGAKDGSN